MQGAQKQTNAAAAEVDLRAQQTFRLIEDLQSAGINVSIDLDILI